MADEDATISYAGAGEGPGSQPDPIEEGTEQRDGPYVSEDDESGAELEDDGGQGGDPADEGEDDAEGGDQPAREARAKPKAIRELEERISQAEARAAEKERQAHGLTIAVQRERQRARILEQRFYQVIDKAMQHTAGAAAAGEEAGEEPEAPGFDPDDPVARLEHGIAEVKERLEEREEREQQEREEKEVADALTWVRNDVHAVLEREPAFPIAAQVVANHARNSIWGNLRLQHPEADENALAAEVERQFAKQTALIQVKCREAGKSYAEVVLEVARSLGWDGGGKAPAAAPAATPPRRRSPLDAERDARRGASSLGHVAGSPPRRQPTAVDAVNMDDDQFAELLESGKIDFKALAAEVAGGR